MFEAGYETLIPQVYASDDPHMDSDVQFGVTRALVGDVRTHDEPHPTDPVVETPWCALDYSVVMAPGEARVPRPPIE